MYIVVKFDKTTGRMTKGYSASIVRHRVPMTCSMVPRMHLSKAKDHSGLMKFSRFSGFGASAAKVCVENSSLSGVFQSGSKKLSQPTPSPRGFASSVRGHGVRRYHVKTSASMVTSEEVSSCRKDLLELMQEKFCNPISKFLWP